MTWIYGLSEAGKKVYHFLISGIRQGLPGTKILDELRKHGLGYRIQDFYNDLRILKGEILRHDTMKYVPKDRIISEKLYTPAVYTAKGNFITRFYIELRNIMTGETYIEYTSVVHDTPMRRMDLEKLAEETIKIKYTDYLGITEVEITKIMPVGGYRKI